jgi:radical SAM superfamily enzyme YgiQ (UPF0313 family)
VWHNFTFQGYKASNKLEKGYTLMPIKVFFADLTHCGSITNADTFPLGIGCIAAYAKKHLGDDIDVELFKFPQDLNERTKQITPVILCLTNYTWNHSLSIAFARYYKRAFPDTVIIMGGPNISVTCEGRRLFLETHDCIDFYCKFEGEEAFVELFLALKDCAFNAKGIKAGAPQIGNMMYLSGRHFVEGPNVRMKDYASIPSPYTTGLFDKFFEQNLRPLVEFTRGCPYACTFCTDSHEHRNKVHRRSIHFVKAELKYIAAHMKTASDLVLADLNFGMFKQDVDVSKILRRVIDEHDWPNSISCSPGKSQPERVLECINIINQGGRGIIKFASSVQSTDATVLDAIKRKNMPSEKISALLEASNRSTNNTEYFTEIILALPEDSRKRHYQSLRDSIDTLGMNIVNVHQLTLLEGSPMALQSQRDLYELDVRYRVFVGCIGEYEVGFISTVIAESEEVVVANATMGFQEWLDCRVMSLLVKIYIDRDYFIEIFGLIRHLGLSAVDLLEELRVCIIPNDKRMSELIGKYLEKTVEPLFPSSEALQEFLSKEGTLEMFKAGKKGGNELLIHRAAAYMEYSEEIDNALLSSTLSYVGKAGLLTPLIAEYISQSIRYSRLRKFDLYNLKDDIVEEVQFDFQKAAEHSFNIHPSILKLKKPKKMRFFYSPSASSQIKYALETWVSNVNINELSKIDLNSDGQTRFNVGKLFHNSNLRLMNKSSEYLT